MIYQLEQGEGVPLERRVDALENLLHTLITSLTAPQAAAPAKVYQGLLAFADGVNWDPGGGAGLYQYVGGSWVKL